MDEDKRNEKLGKAVYGIGYGLFALRFIAVFTVVFLAVMYFLHKPLWLAPIIAAVLFAVYFFIRRYIVTALIRFGNNSSGKKE